MISKGLICSGRRMGQYPRHDSSGARPFHAEYRPGKDAGSQSALVRLLFIVVLLAV